MDFFFRIIIFIDSFIHSSSIIFLKRYYICWLVFVLSQIFVLKQNKYVCRWTCLGAVFVHNKNIIIIFSIYELFHSVVFFVCLFVFLFVCILFFSLSPLITTTAIYFFSASILIKFVFVVRCTFVKKKQQQQNSLLLFT